MDSKLWNPSLYTGTSDYFKRSVGSFSSPKINIQHGTSQHEAMAALDSTSLDFDTYKIPIEVQRTMVGNSFDFYKKKKQLFNLNSFFKPNQSFEKKGYWQKQKPIKSYRKLSNSFKKHTSKTYKTLTNGWETTKGTSYLLVLESSAKMAKYRMWKNQQAFKVGPTNYSIPMHSQRNQHLGNNSMQYFGSYKVKQTQK